MDVMYWGEKSLSKIVEKQWNKKVVGCLSFQISQKLKLLKKDLKDAFNAEPIQIRVQIGGCFHGCSTVFASVHNPVNASQERELATTLHKAHSDYTSFLQS